MGNIKIEDINEKSVWRYKMQGVLEFISGQLYSHPYFPMVLGIKEISILDAAKKWAISKAIPENYLAFNAVGEDEIPEDWENEMEVQLIILNGETWLISKFSS